MPDALAQTFLTVKADGTIQRVIPRITPFEAPASATTTMPSGSKAVVPGTTVTLSPDPSAASAFALLTGACSMENGGGAGAAFGVCELQLNGVARAEFMQDLLGIAGLNIMAAQNWALQLAPGSVNTVRLAVWKSAAVGVFTAVAPHTKLTGVLFEIYA